MTQVLVEYQPHVAAIAKLQAKYKDVVYDVTTQQGYLGADAERKEFTKLFNQFEAVRKKIKEPALELTRQIDAQAKEYTAPLKSRIDELKAALEIEDEKQRIKQAERERLIAEYRATPVRLAGKSSEDMQLTLDALMNADVAGFEEYSNAAQTAIDEAIAQLEPMIAQQQRFEIAAAEQEKISEQQRIAQAEIEAKQRAQQEILDAQQREIDEKNAQIVLQQQAIVDEQNRLALEAQAKIDAETHAKAIEQARIDAVTKAEAERIEQDRLAAIELDRVKALQPDIQKVMTWLQQSVESAPVVSDVQLADLVSKITQNFTGKITALSQQISA